MAITDGKYTAMPTGHGDDDADPSDYGVWDCTLNRWMEKYSDAVRGYGPSGLVHERTHIHKQHAENAADKENRRAGTLGRFVARPMSANIKVVLDGQSDRPPRSGAIDALQAEIAARRARRDAIDDEICQLEAAVRMLGGTFREDNVPF